MIAPAKKALRLLLVVFLVHAGLVATHAGEFWPFSIYPMFSQAGRTWTRAVVRQVPPEMPDSLLARSVSFDALPGAPFPLAEHGIPQNDLSDLLRKTQTWDMAQRDGLHRLFHDSIEPSTHLLIFEVQGGFAEGTTDSIAVAATPLFEITQDSARLVSDLVSLAPRR